jgi:hypothetical protein
MSPRPRTPIASLALALSSALALSPAIAAADGERTAQAEALFQEAVKLLDAGKAAEACPKLEESERLEAGIGTEFRLADCYERIGRTASAWAGFLELAGKVKSPDQIRKARARADALEPRLARLTITVSPATQGLEGLEIQRDGVVVGQASFGAAAPVDPGTHRVRATAKGHEPWEKTVEISQQGTTIEIQIPDLGAAEAGPGAPSPLLSPRRIAAISVGGVGIAGLAAGAALGIMASSTWSDAQHRCPSRLDCPAEAHDLSLRALSFSYGSTAAFAAGGALVATGLILWLTAPSRAPSAPPARSPGAWVLPLVAADHQGAALFGVF